MVQNVESRLTDIEAYIDRGDLRRAYHLWQELEQYARQDGAIVTADLRALRTKIEQEAAEKRRTLTTRLDELLDPSASRDEFDDVKAAHLLEELKQATLASDLDASDYLTYADWVDKFTREKQYQRDYARVYRQVQAKWEEGERLTQDARQQGADVVLQPFKEAAKTVEEAFSRSPDNPLLERLLSQARERRERFADEEEIMTSGGQKDDFVRVLNHISTARDDEYIMVYDIAGNVIGRQKKDEARQTVIDHARPYVRDRLKGYMDAAEAALENRNPRQAIEELKNFEKFEELRKIVPDLVQRDNYESYQELLRKANREAKTLQRAEEAAQAAAEKATHQPKDAWADFEKALAMYPNSEGNSSVLSNARRDLVERTVNFLDDRIETIKQLMNRREFRAAQSEVQLLLRQYKSLADVASTDPVTRLQQLDEKLIALFKDKQDITRTLNEILQEVNDQEIRQAQQMLSTLRGNYEPVLLQEDNLWQTVLDRVGGAETIENQLADLQAMLKSTNVQQVTQAINRADKAAARQHTTSGHGQSESERLQYAREFESVATQLRHYKTYLEAEQALNSDGHREAIRRINDLQRQHGNVLNNDLKERIETRLETLRRDARIIEENNTTLKEIDALLEEPSSPQTIASLLEKLALIDQFIDTAKRQDWVRAVRATLNQLTIQIPFDDNHLNRILRTLENVDPVEYDTWKPRLMAVRRAQKARDGKNARAIWGDMVASVSGDDRAYVLAQIDELNRHELRREADRLMQQATTGASEQRLNIWRQAAEDLIKALQQAILDTTDTASRFVFIRLQVDMELLYAQFVPLQNVRDHLEKVAAFARRELEPRIATIDAGVDRAGSSGFPPQIRDDLRAAKRLLILTTAAPTVGKAFDLVQEHLTAQSAIDRFKAALDAWRAIFPPQTGDTVTVADELPPPHPYLQDLDASSYQSVLRVGYDSLYKWYLERERQVKAALEERITSVDDTTDKMTSDALSASAKTLLLDSKDVAGRRMLNRLASLRFQLAEMLDNVLETLPNARGFDGETPAEQFNNQRRHLAEQIDYLRLIQKVSEQLPDDLLPNKNPRQISDMYRVYMRLLEEIDGELNNVENATDDYSRQLSRFPLNQTTAKNIDSRLGQMLSQYMREVQEIIERIEQALTRAEAEGTIIFDNQSRQSTVSGRAHQAALTKFTETHPWVQEQVQRTEERKTRYKRFAYVVMETKRIIEAHLPIDKAYRLINDYRIGDEPDFRSSKLFRKIEVIIDETSGTRLEGWLAIRQYVEDTANTFSKIHQWSRHYYTSETPPPPSPRIVNWATLQDETIQAEIERMQDLDDYLHVYQNEEVRAYMEGLLRIETYREGVRFQIEYLMAQGRFKEVYDRLERVLSPEASDENLLNGLQSLTEADAVFSSPPLVDEDRVADSYDEARQHAGSQQVRERLDWMETYRYKVYRQYKEDAEQLLTEAHQMQANWLRLTEDYESQLITLDMRAEELDNSNFLNRGGRRSDACEAYAEVKKSIRQMKNLCPQHHDLPSIEHHPIILEAQSILDEYGGCNG